MARKNSKESEVSAENYPHPVDQLHKIVWRNNDSQDILSVKMGLQKRICLYRVNLPIATVARIKWHVLSLHNKWSNYQTKMRNL
jgi:hypothetical protein